MSEHTSSSIFFQTNATRTQQADGLAVYPDHRTINGTLAGTNEEADGRYPEPEAEVVTTAPPEPTPVERALAHLVARAEQNHSVLTKGLDRTIGLTQPEYTTLEANLPRPVKRLAPPPPAWLTAEQMRIIIGMRERLARENHGILRDRWPAYLEGIGAAAAHVVFGHNSFYDFPNDGDAHGRYFVNVPLVPDFQVAAPLAPITRYLPVGQLGNSRGIRLKGPSTMPREIRDDQTVTVSVDMFRHDVTRSLKEVAQPDTSYVRQAARVRGSNAEEVALGDTQATQPLGRYRPGLQGDPPPYTGPTRLNQIVSPPDQTS